jgi:hypothetical protein
MLITDEALEALKAKDSRAKKFTLKLDEGKQDVVLRPPSWSEYSAWRQIMRSNDDRKTISANRQLLLFCCLWPDPKGPDYQPLIDRYPGIADNLSNHIGTMAGLTAEVEVGD